MKKFNKIIKTVGLMFIFTFIFTLFGCDMTTPTAEQLKEPSFIVTTNDNKATVFIESTQYADGYYLYIYQNDGLKNKFSVNENDALMGFNVFLSYGEYQFAVQAVDSTKTYASSTILTKKVVTLTEKVKPHEKNHSTAKSASEVMNKLDEDLNLNIETFDFYHPDTINILFNL